MADCIPDGLVEDPSDRQHGILEIKCPYSASTMTPETVCEELSCSLVAGQVALKKLHSYYYQIQPDGNYKQAMVGLLCMNASVNRIKRDIKFWQQKNVS